MNSKRGIWNGLLNAVIVIVVILAIALAGVRIAGMTPFAVLSGSMEPAYPVGSLVYVMKTECSELREGDVITFAISEEMTATHRIIEVIRDENDPEVLRFRTKGDSNPYPDTEPVDHRNVVGRAVFRISYLGYVSDFVSNPPGIYFTVAGIALLLMLTYLADSPRGRDKPTSEE